MEFNTDICGLSLELKKDKLAIILNGKKRWVIVPKNIQKKLTKLVDEHFEYEEYLKNMTPEQAKEHWAEYSCS